MDTTVAVLLIDEGNRIFLVLNPLEGKKLRGWGMPRGRREEKDIDEVATGIRECEEETGYRTGIDERYRVEEQIGDHKSVAFVGYVTGGSLRINKEELLDGKWVNPRVLWVTDPGFYIHPLQRRMAQKLWKIQKEGPR